MARRIRMGMVGGGQGAFIAAVHRIASRMDDRIDFVSIVTPNKTHAPVAETFLRAGFHVVRDEPMTFDLDEAKDLVKLVERTGLVFVLTHNYTGNALVREARERFRSGEMGPVPKVLPST